MEGTNSYFSTRMQELGITEDINQVQLYQNIDNENVLRPFPIFRETEKGIEILVYSLDRCKIPYAKEGSRWKNKDFCIIRLEEPIIKQNGDQIKYQLPKGAGTYPFFPPALLEKYEHKTPIDTLFLTEGYFKAFKGFMHGLDIIGLSSITHMKEKDKNTLHSDIISLIRGCSVKKVVWLTDGDCLDVTKKDLEDGIDLYKRPNGFFRSAINFKSLMEDKALGNEDMEKYFVHVDSEQIEGRPKGLDDLLIARPEEADEIVADLRNLSRTEGRYFWKMQITHGVSRLQKHFMLSNVNEFYEFHAQRRPDLRNISFTFNGTKYRYNEEKNECVIEIPRESKNYFRVGDNYYEFVKTPNKYGQLELVFHRRLKTTIIDDHGAKFIGHVPKYKAFCNVPDHANYQQVIYSNFNTYHPFEHEPEAIECTEEDFPTICRFLKHIFGTKEITFTKSDGEAVKVPYYQLGYDYLQLLYQQPTHILPIICLVSKENETGKSTFAKFLKQVFTQNVAIVGNADLADNFNAHWATKLVVICDETKIDKQSVVEKVKSLSTADKIMMNAKGKDHVEIDCFLKFIFITNNEENFIYATEEDLRYWIIKVPKLEVKDPGMENLFKEEIPALVSFLNHRKLVTERKSRMWFDPAILKTEALRKVIAHSKPGLEKEIRQHLREMFLDFGVETITMSRKDIHQEFFNGRGESNYIERILKDYIKAEPYYAEEETPAGVVKKYVTKRYSYPRWVSKEELLGRVSHTRVEVSRVGRPYVFKQEDFLTAEEIRAVTEEFKQKEAEEAPETGLEIPF